MARRSIPERIAQLDARKKALQARLSKQERAVDTRRKVLLGAFLLQRLETGHDPEFTRRLTDWLKRELPGFLTRENDRALFPEFIRQETGSGTAMTESAAAGSAGAAGGSMAEGGNAVAAGDGRSSGGDGSQVAALAPAGIVR